MAFGHLDILALGESRDEDSNFVGILGGNNDMPRIIRGYPVYWGINRNIFCSRYRAPSFLIVGPPLVRHIGHSSKVAQAKKRGRGPARDNHTRLEKNIQNQKEKTKKTRPKMGIPYGN